MALDLIGAGLGRTGTMSLKAALEHLGFPTYHMVELFQDPSRIDYWDQAAETGETDWSAVFDGYTAMVDYPASLYWRTLAKLYPTAKVILTVRDADKWYDSVMATIFPSSGPREYGPGEEHRKRIHAMARKVIWEGQFEGRFRERSFAIEKFRAWNASVEEELPEGRLLVYRVGEGWERLCAFLGLPVPDIEFPKTNSREQFLARPITTSS
jgi:hypothetical protein